ncbi:MAG: hypothetical protein QXW32_00360 [Nitrososphaerales archaeon]
MELLISALVVGGIAILLGVSYYLYRARYTKKRTETKPKVNITQLDFKNRGTLGKQVTDLELEKAKREVKTLLLEKELVTGAITRLYEAEASGKISREEREKLSGKYREQLREIETKLSDLSLIIEVGELENLRQELVDLFERKIAQIETRLKEARAQLEAIKGLQPTHVEEELKPKAIVEEKKVERRKKASESEADSKIKEIRDEVLDALARLEQIDLEG